MKKTLNFISSKLLIISTLCIAFFATLLAMPTQKTFAETPNKVLAQEGDDLAGKKILVETDFNDDFFTIGSLSNNFYIYIPGIMYDGILFDYQDNEFYSVDFELNTVIFDFDYVSNYFTALESEDAYITQSTFTSSNGCVVYILNENETNNNDTNANIEHNEEKSINDYIEDFGKGIKDFFDLNDNVKNLTVGIIGIVVIAFILSRIFKRK